MSWAQAFPRPSPHAPFTLFKIVLVKAPPLFNINFALLSRSKDVVIVYIESESETIHSVLQGLWGTNCSHTSQNYPLPLPGVKGL